MSMIIDGTNGLTFNNATTQASAGQVLQVVSSTIVAVASTTNNTFTSTGHTVTITPKFATSKIYVVATGDGGTSLGTASAWYSVFRNGSTNLSTGTALGAAASMYSSSVSGNFFSAVAMSFLDSPSTTSSTTYTVYFGNSSGSTTYWAPVPGTPSSPSATITVMEIAA